MKKLIVLILCLCMSLSFAACTETTAETETETEIETETENFSHRIKRVYTDVTNGESILQNTSDERILVDSETGVMYLFVKSGYGGGLTVMVDENGDPLLWKDSEVTE